MTPENQRDEKKKLKCYEITPAGDSRFDTIIVQAKEGWSEAVYHCEQSLESQFLNDKEWDEISVTVKCVYKTQQELDDLETE